MEIRCSTRKSLRIPKSEVKDVELARATYTKEMHQLWSWIEEQSEGARGETRVKMVVKCC